MKCQSCFNDIGTVKSLFTESKLKPPIHWEVKTSLQIEGHRKQTHQLSFTLVLEVKYSILEVISIVLEVKPWLKETKYIEA